MLRDARKILAQLAKFDGSKFGVISSYESEYVDGAGRSKPCLLLPWLETMTLLSGYSVPMRAKVIARWAELENAARPLPAPAIAAPPQELFPPNAVERIADTAITHVKRWGKSVRDSVWQTKQAITNRLDLSEKAATDQRRYLAQKAIRSGRDRQARRRATGGAGRSARVLALPDAGAEMAHDVGDAYARRGPTIHSAKDQE